MSRLGLGPRPPSEVSESTTQLPKGYTQTLELNFPMLTLTLLLSIIRKVTNWIQCSSRNSFPMIFLYFGLKELTEKRKG